MDTAAVRGRGAIMDPTNVILSYIREALLDDPEIEISKDTSLFQDRVLDSLNLVALITFLEKTFDISINPSEVIIENLDTVSNMLNLLEKKKVL